MANTDWIILATTRYIKVNPLPDTTLAHINLPITMETLDSTDYHQIIKVNQSLNNGGEECIEIILLTFPTDIAIDIRKRWSFFRRRGMVAP